VHQSGEVDGSSINGRVVTIKKKFVLALVAYAVLGVLAWTTLSDEPIRVFNASVRLRTGTLLILGLFALRAALYFWRTRIEQERENAKPTD
jgi:asparagine N-glycosylation enzyme membrane subunit Stt3